MDKSNFARYVMAATTITALLLSHGSSVWAQTIVKREAQSTLAPPKYGHCVDVNKEDPRACGNVNSGKGYGVCEAYLKHLNSSKETPYCEIPKPPDFRSPDWEEMDVLKHLDWAYSMDIRYRVPAGYTPPSFENWRKTFLDNLHAGKIAPQMRKARINPLGTEEATILGYTGDKLSCQRVLNKELNGNKWAAGGYVHWELIADATQPFRKVGERTQGEFMLFAGKTYFVHSYDTIWSPAFSVYRFWHRLPEGDKGDLSYVTEQICQFKLFKPILTTR